MGWANTRYQKKLAAEFKARCTKDNTPCHLCGQPIDYTAPPQTPDAFELDHYYPRSTHPELVEDPANFRAAHSNCNRSRGKGTAIHTLGNQSEQW
ncbi:HNH endonuclease [Corynebacterium striatum]|uniref:HNH endonuclease n=1 Tax=Corynebacterium striatum TaxID=43770 RepID=A0ABC8CM14_CORST|nr:HNH endonuclease [Corynebacterium striatum]ATZ08318.1 HNH endonuclease [Corynebacterium striatum]EGT5592394.1 HNH endonuclease [Corynebacterium striatum]EGT5613278.1 HNH endonuclease [Corynebacterium striatum]